ncbi:MAG: SusC/RagA family TonB-linked outer membrane protein [Bacteroidales bacterium]|nr:SusC/RagA family TonB-linked outer membrane protein [Bacteroidales bacterium]MDD4770348.1 SusC/RagA family TonB-linked outer membrane protein [Bacteroidales bacterium]
MKKLLGSFHQRVNVFRSSLMLLFMVVSLHSFAQATLSGKVVDTSGEPIIGASIQVKGTSTGTVTNLAGAFSIQARPTQVLLVSYLGYITQEVSVGNRSFLEIQLLEDVELLDEVVVVGYGTQKKTTVTGAVAQVRGDNVLRGKASTNVATALQGTIPGLTITRTSSRPGNENTSITLRGGVSVNAVNPMIIIDGIEAYQWELSQINPKDIDNVSVLKDAAASIYGTRAAGGVILVTTKRGKAEKVQVSYTGSVHQNIVGNRFPVASGQEWAQMNVEANKNDAVASGSLNNWWLFTGDVYNTLAQGLPTWREDGKLYLDPRDEYSNQFDFVYGNTWGQDHNVTVSGGSDKVRVLSSIGFAKDRSLVKFVYDGTEKMNFRTNVDYDVNKWIKAELNLSYDKRLVSTPTNGVGHGIQDFFIFPMYNEKGQFYDAFGSNNLLAKMKEGGRTDNTERLFRLGGKVTLDMGMVDALKGLTITANANVKERDGYRMVRATTITMYDWDGETQKPNNIFYQTPLSGTSVAYTYANNVYSTYGLFANYNRKMGLNTLALLGGVTAEEENFHDLYGKRSYMLDDHLNAINTGDAAYDDNSGNAWSWSMISYLAKLNYDYNETYLLEAIYRRDGSSKLAPENRWADFVGFSAGVRLTQFDLINNWNVFDNLKIRASYGETGSLSGIGNYDYISNITLGTTVFGSSPAQSSTAYVAAMTSRDRTWERVATSNFGVDYAFLNNRLSGAFDYFVRQNKGMLINVVYPSVLGATAPQTNDGNFTAKGFELELNWRDKITSDLSYYVGASLSDARTEVTSYPGKTVYNPGVNAIIEGKPINSIYVYRTDGYLQNEQEVTDYYTAVGGAGSIIPPSGTVNRLIPGCVRKVDLSQDGKITTDDLDYLGDANPHYTMGFNVGASYKSFDLTFFLQGVGQQNIVRTDQMSAPFRWGWTNQNRTFLGNTWTVENPNAAYPVMTRNGQRNNWNYAWVNDLNVTNVSYLRMKNIVLGYTLPTTLINKIGISNARVWMSGDNLFEFHNVKDGFDPESNTKTGQGNVDVFARTVSLGVDVRF